MLNSLKSAISVFCTLIYPYTDQFKYFIMSLLWRSYLGSLENGGCSQSLAYFFFFLIYFVWMLSHVWLCNPMDYSPLGSSVYGISQARILEWIAISSSTEASQPREWTSVSYLSCTAGGFLASWAFGEAHKAFLLAFYWKGQSER